MNDFIIGFKRGLKKAPWEFIAPVVALFTIIKMMLVWLLRFTEEYAEKHITH